MADKDQQSSYDDTSAADEPTAMWDANALKDLGLEEASKAHEEPARSNPLAPSSTAPETPAARARPRSVPKKKQQNASTGPSIPVLVTLSIGVGLLVYFLVTFALS